MAHADLHLPDTSLDSTHEMYRVRYLIPQAILIDKLHERPFQESQMVLHTLVPTYISFQNVSRLSKATPSVTLDPQPQTLVAYAYYQRADIARITRKEPKPDKNEHGNGKSTQKPEFYEQKSNKCMRTRNSYFPNNPSVTILRRRNKRRDPNVVEPELRIIVEVAPMADNQTMEELLQAPTEGYEEAIVIPDINADHFEIKTNLLQLVQANPYHRFEMENPHTHINNFKRITSTLKFRNVPNDVIKLMMFPYSLEGAARVWENASKTDDMIDKLADQISTIVEVVSKKVVTPAMVKAVVESCVTCGVWRLKSLSEKGLGFDALLVIVGGNGAKSNGVKRKDLVWVRMSVNHHNILP
nr:reverse transcriptase domain-containing protein [Tanacetum cinerariifolium]